LVDAVLKAHGETIGSEVSANGPHPSSPGGFVPRFWIHAGTIEPSGFEPLVNSWVSGSVTTLWPDQGLLMTYGLAPQCLENKILWNDLATPSPDIIVVQPTSVYDSPKASEAFVKIRSHYLQDYATLRGMAVMQTYFARGRGTVPPNTVKLLKQSVHRLSLKTERIFIPTGSRSGDERDCHGKRLGCAGSRAPW
jgi:hypothetical protein